MRLVFAGTPQPAVPALRSLLESARHQVAAVITRPPARAGRGRRLAARPVAELAEEAGVPVLSPASPSDPEFLAQLSELAPDCCAVVAYGALLRPAALEVPTHGWINLHFSLLPAWRGAAPVQHALLRGDDITGASTFRIEEGLDTGPIYGVVTETIRADDTAGTLLDRLSASGAGLLAATMDGIEDRSLRPVPQAVDGVSLAPKITVDEARVDWDKPARHVDRLVRACTPAPGAWTNFRGARLKLGPLRPAGDPGPDAEPLAPGELSQHKSSVEVGTVDGRLVLDQVQPPGKRAMAALDWARGARLRPGERLG